jgi:hypothetical protein
MEFPSSVSAVQFRAFMHQPAHQVSAFLRDCAQRRWANPPLDVLLADGLTAGEADALQGVDGGVGCTPSLPICFSAQSRTSSMMSTQMRTMTLVPHEPRWLPTGCSGKS